MSGSGSISADREAAAEPARGEAAPDPKPRRGSTGANREKLPIKMLNDRILVQMEGPDGERKSTGGILIPATAQVGKRLTWAEVVAVGPSVRSMELGDRVLFNPEDRYEVEVGGHDYIILRERDIHAVAAERLDDSPTGLYL
ncbi:MAG: co-chaperone GroES [Acidimicrobiales bacterium]